MDLSSVYQHTLTDVNGVGVFYVYEDVAYKSW